MTDSCEKRKENRRPALNSRATAETLQLIRTNLLKPNQIHKPNQASITLESPVTSSMETFYA
jgi:hypothetical protein